MAAVRSASIFLALGLLGVGGGLGGGLGGATSVFAADGKTIALADADRQAVEKLLGAGVIGKAAAAAPLAPSLANLRDGTLTYEIVGGEGKGSSEQHVIKKLDRDPSGASWRYAAGDKHVLFLTKAADGGIAVLSEQDIDQGVVSRFDPPEPLLVPGLQPGDTKTYSIDVKVYDLSHPDHETHSGSLALTYAHLGAYEITTPMGTQTATLIKWTYDGKVGPATVEDSQYRFLVDQTGMVAGIDRKHISALLIYHDDSKVGKMLTKGP